MSASQAEHGGSIPLTCSTWKTGESVDFQHLRQFFISFPGDHAILEHHRTFCWWGNRWGKSRSPSLYFLAALRVATPMVASSCLVVWALGLAMVTPLVSLSQSSHYCCLTIITTALRHFDDRNRCFPPSSTIYAYKDQGRRKHGFPSLSTAF